MRESEFGSFWQTGTNEKQYMEIGSYFNKCLVYTRLKDLQLRKDTDWSP